jgi:hypothetical protein
MILLVVFLVVVYWLRPVKQTAKSESAPEPIQQTTNTPAASAAIANVPGQAPHPAQPSINPSLIASSDAQKLNAVQQYNERRNAPIEFYGQVIDQDSNFMAGVRIKLSIPQSQMFAPTPSGDYPISNNLVQLGKETGADGRFEITSENGSGVEIQSIQKSGYVPENGLPHSFGAAIGNLESPVIFKMWSTNIHEQLISGDKKFQIVPDRRVYFFNFTSGTISESDDGDLKVWINYTNPPVRGQLSDWSAEIDVINGGLLEETDANAAMYLAPSEGYLSTFHLEQQIKSGQSGEIGSRRFYFKLEKGQKYGRMTINLYAPFNNLPGLIRLSYAINPSGSRILR